MANPDTADVLVEVDNGIAVLTLSNPPLNVVTVRLTRQLYAALKGLQDDERVGALVLTGHGDRAFCAGSDISELPDMTAPGAALERKLIFQNRVFDALRRYPKPVIVALNGHAYGGGLEIALCGDIVVAETQIKVCLPELNLGVFPSSGGTFRLSRRIGVARAKNMIFFGEPIPAQQACDWGIVNQVVATGEAKGVARALATRLSLGPRTALAKAKHLVDHAWDVSDAQAVAESLSASDEVFSGPECREGVTAFLEKREPEFSKR
jgi:enoyl-CoA hydratase